MVQIDLKEYALATKKIPEMTAQQILRDVTDQGMSDKNLQILACEENIGNIQR